MEGRDLFALGGLAISRESCWEGERSAETVLSLAVPRNNIYRYYFLLYITTGLASMGYAVSNSTSILYALALFALMFLFLMLGTQDVTKLVLVGQGIKESMAGEQPLEMEEITDDY